jgi:YegS/Rv2252/BmrU family lipid kinase
MDSPKKRLLFLVNPVSGVNQEKKASLSALAAEVLDASLYTWEVVVSETPGQLYELSKAAAENNTDVVVAVGGDGTVNQVAKGIFGSKTILGLVPAGSGNGLAHYLGIPTDIQKSLAVINKMNVKDIDTVNMNDRLFVSIAGVGFDARVAQKYDRNGSRGFLSYFKIVAREYTNYRPRKYRMVIDGKPVVRQALFVSFANTNQFGYNTIIAPDAKIDDGLVDVCIVKKVPLALAPQVAGLLLTKKLGSSDFVEIIKAREISLTRNKNRVVNIDGEPLKLGKSLNIKVNPLSLKVIVP